MFKKILTMGVLLVASMTAWAELPSVTLKDINGKTVNTAELSNDGKPIIISFFATWCKPCLRELSAINDVFPDWVEETGVKLVAVSIDEAQNAQKVKPLVERKGYTDYEVLLDPNSEFKRQMGVDTPPHAFIVDGKGNIVWSHQGYIDGGEQEMYEEIIKLVK
ncbi:MAG: TlpA family protein disulfide reductase [Prevotella sp.]|nr:TlpA family protein disulfide reductase [Bacteroides sp.]MCM1367145.1 TlpA family protein disulfide reductase [Prevotella sp.]MCM1436541.1 TlpA family protein disulfide reductase [Prevotella sp.]